MGNKFLKTISKHSPEILTGLGITGIFVTSYLTIISTKKAIAKIDEMNSSDHCGPVSKKEKFKKTWKFYIPPMLSATTASACLIGANSLNKKRSAAIAAAATLSETAFRTYQNKVIDAIGKEEEKKIRDNVSKKIVESTEDDRDKNLYIIDGTNDTLCLDELSGRYFYSSVNKLEKIENEMNHDMINCGMAGYKSLNDLYFEIGLDPTSIGNTIGWNYDYLIDFDFSSQLTKDGKPCLVLQQRNMPTNSFMNI